MKHLSLLSALMLTMVGTLFAQLPQQPGSLQRLSLDSALAPFYHGVASGDPLDDAVIIWTRVTAQDTSLQMFDVHWEMATDTSFATIVDSGTVSTGMLQDYTVKIDVTGLQPFTWYYYRFSYDGTYSVTGRTKTAPDNMVNQLRFGVVSCSDYKNGYFNAYGHLAGRNDIDAVIHLGDYIYEYATGGSLRGHEPPNEIVTLSDYRGRFSHYRLDADLRAVHQQYPFITIWDDHETANNAWTGGAQNHTPGTEGNWTDRVAGAMQTYYEWMPIRDPQGPNPYQGYRKVSYGKLADILVLETRLDDRDEQDGSSSAVNDTSRHIISPTQMNWLLDGLSDTSSRWKIIAQQVMMAPLTPGGIIFNNDQWDGYVADRNRIYDHVLNNGIENMVVLTGDIHTAWANNLERGSTPVGVEFVTTSVTSSSGNIPLSESLITSILPHVKYVELQEKGYYILDIRPDTTQANFYYVNTIATPDTSASFETAWYVLAGGRTLAEGVESFALPMQPIDTTGPVDTTDTTGVVAIPIPESAGTSDQLLIIGAYPNPFNSELVIQYNSGASATLQLKVYDLQGKEVLEQGLANEGGVNYTKIDGSGLSPGHYILTLTDGEQVFKRRVVKGQ